MFGGFTFDGVDIDNLGLEFAPEGSNTYSHKATNSTVSEQRFEGHDGGYFYGETAQPKDFVLRCFYMGKNVTQGLMTRIYQVFRVGKTGRLVFKYRPWCWYVATVMNVDCTQLLNYANGLVTITLRAYYPYARTDMFSIPDFTDYEMDIKLNSGLLFDYTRIPNYVLESGKPVIGFRYAISERQDILLYNPGTERAKVAIEIAGDTGDGVLITNHTTGQTCKFVGLSIAETSTSRRYLVADGLNGKVALTGGNQPTQLAFLYHDHGFIELEPGFPIVRDIDITTTNNSTTIASDKIIIDDVIGKYIYTGDTDKWKKITAYDENTFDITINEITTVSNSLTTDIVTMNEISIEPVSTMFLTKLNFVYLPTFA